MSPSWPGDTGWEIFLKEAAFLCDIRTVYDILVDYELVESLA